MRTSTALKHVVNVDGRPISDYGDDFESRATCACGYTSGWTRSTFMANRWCTEHEVASKLTVEYAHAFHDYSYHAVWNDGVRVATARDYGDYVTIFAENGMSATTVFLGEVVSVDDVVAFMAQHLAVA